MRRSAADPSLVLLALALLACTPEPGPGDAAQAAALPDPGLALERAASDCPDHDPAGNVYFGDTHVHTAFSLDAVAQETVGLGPAAAYAFARGEAIDHPKLGPYRIGRPLDFAVVTDHAEFFDLIGMCLADPANPNYDEPACQALRDDPGLGLLPLVETSLGIYDASFLATEAADRGRRWVWREVQRATNTAHTPCDFTAMIGYEWTGGSLSQDLNRGTLHRNVIFRSSTVPELPADARRFDHERKLWSYLHDECTAFAPPGGCGVLAIPHGSNQTRNGEIWAVANDADARLRAAYERLAEVYQIKGNSECLNANLDPQDPGFDPGCRFERNTFRALPDGAVGVDFGDAGRLAGTVRHALAQGLNERADRGLNPLELGLIGSTDTHSATPGDVSEATFPGTSYDLQFVASPEEAPSFGSTYERGPGGLAAVWAPANTRGEIFAALHRREAYATSGPRIRLRFVATGAATGEACGTGRTAGAGVADGAATLPAALLTDEATVPMGGVVAADAAAGDAVHLVVHATADRTPLDRIELVRVARTAAPADGATAPAAGATVTAAADAAPGTRVDVWTLAQAGAKGADRLCAALPEPDLPPPPADGARDRLYYVRAVEQERPRWTGYACAARPELCAGKPVPMTVAERAWSSPIWVYP